MLGVGSSIWNRALAGKGAGDGGNPPAEATPIHSLDLTAAPSASNAFDDYGLATSRTVTDYNGRIVQIPADAVPMGGLRPVRNLWPTADGSDTPSTQVITVTSGRVYQLRIGAESASGATAVCSGAFTGTLTGDGADIQAFDTGKTAMTTSLTVTITGSVRKIQLQDITHRADLSTAPDEFVSTDDDYGTGVNGFRYFDTELDNTVDGSGVVNEGTGASIDGWLDYQPLATNYIKDSNDLSTANWSTTATRYTVTAGADRFGDIDMSSIVVTNDADFKLIAEASSALNSPYTDVVLSCYLKILGDPEYYQTISVQAGSANHFTAVIAQTAGVPSINNTYAVGTGYAIDSAEFVNLGSGYYRFVMRGTIGGTGTVKTLFGAKHADTGAQQYTSFAPVAVGAGMSVGGIQLETGTVTTGVIPTSGTSASRPAMNPAPTIAGLVGTEDARLVVKGLAADLVTPDPTDDTERTLDVDNTDGEFDTLPLPIKVLSVDVYNDGERPA